MMINMMINMHFWLPIKLPPQFASSSFSSSADPNSALMNQMVAMSLRHSEDTTKILANQEELRTHLLLFVHHIVIIKLVWIIPLLSISGSAHATGYSCPHPAEGPPFEPWVVRIEPVGMNRLVVDETDAPLYASDKDFIPNEWVVPCFPPFWSWQKGREEAGVIWRF